MLRAADIQHNSGDIRVVWLHGFDDCIHNGLKFVASKARWNQHYAGVLGISRDSLLGELNEVHDIGRYESPSVSRCIGELGSVVQLDIAHFLRCGDVHAAPSQKAGNDRRQILIEIQFHPVKRTSPGNRLSMFSGVKAAFASILAWTSSR